MYMQGGPNKGGGRRGCFTWIYRDSDILGAHRNEFVIFKILKF